jgi:hypothetical protein
MPEASGHLFREYGSDREVGRRRSTNCLEAVAIGTGAWVPRKFGDRIADESDERIRGKGFDIWCRVLDETAVAFQSSVTVALGRIHRRVTTQSVTVVPELRSLTGLRNPD